MSAPQRMNPGFKRFLCISTETSNLPDECFSLERISWKDLSQLGNLSDYDSVYINLGALGEIAKSQSLSSKDIAKVFDSNSWAQVLAGGGAIYLLGHPPSILARFEAHSQPQRYDPTSHLVTVRIDSRPVDYRRVDRSSPELILQYLDQVSQWNYSMEVIILSPDVKEILKRLNSDTMKPERFGQTSYRTFLAARFLCNRTALPHGALFVLPPSGNGPEMEDYFIVKHFFGIATAIEEPHWVSRLKIPGQTKLENQLNDKKERIEALKNEVKVEEGQLVQLKRWYQLLYDDGDTLEAIVKEGLELLGAKVTKPSREKADYFIDVPDHPKGVMEVKGTHKPKFGIGALGQLSRWMDEAILKEQAMVKGIFVGNAGRKEEPQNRKLLFENNGEEFADLKGVVILRAMDLFCLVVLKNLNLLNTVEFWNEFFNCKGTFDAAKFWNLLPQEFRLPEP